MKHMSKLLALVLALTMVLSMATAALAATITVPDEKEGDQNTNKETYIAYKIFDVEKVMDDDKVTGHAYSIAADDTTWLPVLWDTTNNQAHTGQNWIDLTLTADQSKYVVSLKTGVDNNDTTAKAIAAFLLQNKGNITGTTLNAGVNTVDDGYYLITSTLGSNLALATADIPLNIAEKNTYPSLTKAADKTTASIGETVTFTLTLTVPESVDKPIVVHDKMEAGFTLTQNSIAAKDGSNNAVSFTEVTGKTDSDCTFELSFAAENAKGKTITITYQAMLNGNAEFSTETNDNTAWLTYSNFQSANQTFSVTTYTVDLVKTGPEKKDAQGTYSVLDGAQFELYDAETGGNEIKLVKVETADVTYYRPALAGETAEAIVAGEATIKGLAGNKTYHLQETKAPAGYNQLTDRTAVTVAEANLTNTAATGGTYTRSNDTGVQVINQTGTELPSTGGIGTTIFYVLGGILVVGAGVLLVTKKRMNDAQ